MGIATPSLPPDESMEQSGETQVQTQTAETGNLSSIVASPPSNARPDYFTDVENFRVPSYHGRSDVEVDQDASDRMR